MDNSALFDDALTASMLISIVIMSVGLTFAYAALAKVASFGALVSALRVHYRLKGSVATLGAIALILCEAAVAISHIGGIALKAILPATTLLLVMFLVSVITTLRRGEEKPCLCFGANRNDPVDFFSLFRLVLLLLIEILLLWGHYATGDHPVATTSLLTRSQFVTLVLVSATSTALASCFFSVPRIFRTLKVIVDV